MGLAGQSAVNGRPSVVKNSRGVCAWGGRRGTGVIRELLRCGVENSEGISHPLTLHTSLIAATSTDFILTLQASDGTQQSCRVAKQVPSRSPRTLRIVCNADALTLPISSPV
jgi:hypothetical protein